METCRGQRRTQKEVSTFYFVWSSASYSSLIPYVNQIGPLSSKDPPDGTSFLPVGALELQPCATTCNLTWILKSWTESSHVQGNHFTYWVISTTPISQSLMEASTAPKCPFFVQGFSAAQAVLKQTLFWLISLYGFFIFIHRISFTISFKN